MVDSTGAKSLYNWIVEPDSDGSTFNARKLKQNTEEITNYSDAATMFAAINTDLTNGTGKKGGTVGIRNGTYSISVSAGSGQGFQIGHSSTDTGATVTLIGESRDGTIILNATTFSGTAAVIGVRSNFEIRNMTVDGNNDPNTNCVKNVGAAHGSALGYINAFNCKFINAGIHGFRVGAEEKWASSIVQDCEFINGTSDDMCSIHPLTYGAVMRNYFNRTGEGSSITSGEGTNQMEIAYNYVTVNNDDENASISVEPYTTGFSNCEIHHNNLNRASIKAGNTGAINVPMTNIHIHHNTVKGGRIKVLGPSGAGEYAQIKNIFIDNNRCIVPYRCGIQVDNIGSLVVIKDNIIVDSNSSLANPATQVDANAMYLTDIKHLMCTDNTIIMGVTSPENAYYSPEGIAYAGLEHSVIRDNRFFNTTLAPNPNYANEGSHVGTKNIFSHTS